MSRENLIVLNTLLCLVVAVLLGHFLLDRPVQLRASRDYGAQYKFTNPILDYEDVKMKEPLLFWESINSKIEKLEDRYDLLFSSVYYRNLENGQWIGVNEKEFFTSASLIKLPVLISLLREQETKSDFLEKRVEILKQDFDGVAEQDIKSGSVFSVGESYTLLEVAERMIVDSDNVAMQVLLRNIEKKYREGIFESVGVAFDVKDKDLMVQVKDYAGFFRVLFNASYLGRDNSERALEILSKVKFDKGIVAGVPKGITVAHKFGERSSYVNGMLSSRQLHDCGIIYYPDNPYILCIMTRGYDFDKQASFIKEISQFFYKELEKSL